jgi:hypothetical protein
MREVGRAFGRLQDFLQTLFVQRGTRLFVEMPPRDSLDFCGLLLGRFIRRSFLILLQRDPH